MLRPAASSLPLGFFAFGTGSIQLTALKLHWVPAAQAPPVMVLVLAFVVPLELLAGVFAFLARDRGAAAAGGRAPGWRVTSATRSSTPSGSRASAASCDAGARLLVMDMYGGMVCVKG